MSKPVFTYFNGRGYGEAIRIALAAAGIQYEEVDLTSREEFLALSDKLCFGQVPLLEIDGHKIVQSRAILGYIGRKYNLYGKDDTEAMKIDMLREGARDFYEPLGGILIAGTEEEVVGKFRKNNFTRYMNIYEKLLSEGGGQYLVGNSVSLADTALLEVLLAIEDFMKESAMDDYPKVQAYYQGLKKLPNIQKYLAEHRRPKNTPEYFQIVMTVLAAEDKMKEMLATKAAKSPAGEK